MSVITVRNKSNSCFGLSESKLSYFHPDSGFLINGFQMPFRRDRQENAGEKFLVYVKDVGFAVNEVLILNRLIWHLSD